MSHIINKSDYDAFSNVLANAILDRKELSLNKDGIVQIGTTSLQKTVSASEVEEIAIGIIHSLRNSRVNEQVVIDKRLHDFIKHEYRPQIDAITSAIAGRDELAIEQTLFYLTNMSHHSMHFENNEVIRSRMANIGNAIDKAESEGSLLPQNILDDIANFRDVLELRQERFLGGKDALELPTDDWENHKKQKTLTSDVRGQLVQTVLGQLNQFLNDQKALSMRLSEQAKSPDLVRYISPSPVEREGLFNHIKSGSTVESVEEPDAEEPLPPSPPLSRSSSVSSFESAFENQVKDNTTDIQEVTVNRHDDWDEIDQKEANALLEHLRSVPDTHRFAIGNGDINNDLEPA